jgi:hypothetical protein
MKISKIASVARPIDPSYPTNRAIVALVIVVVVGAAVLHLVTGKGWPQSGLRSIGAGMAVFFAWALCRELDPDHDLSAFVATGLALVGLFFWDLPNLGALLWVLLVVRIVNRTAGLPATVLDSLAVLGLGGWLSVQGNWGYGVITTTALFLDSQLVPRNRRQILFAGLGVAITIVAAVMNGAIWGEGDVSPLAGLIGLGISVVFVPVVVGAGRVESVGDETGEVLRPVRVQMGQGLALLAGVAVAFWGGEVGLVSMLPLWAAALGGSIYWLVMAIGK